MSKETEQLLLPYESGPVREVSWFNADRVEKKRRFLRDKVLTELVIDPETNLASRASILGGDIDKIQDPDLRYALRLYDAAQVVGCHFVQIEAIGSDYEANFVKADYSGVTKEGVDTFMQDLQRQAPQPDVPGMSTVLVYGENSSPDTRFWVRSR